MQITIPGGRSGLELAARNYSNRYMAQRAGISHGLVLCDSSLCEPMYAESAALYINTIKTLRASLNLNVIEINESRCLSFNMYFYVLFY